MDTALSNKLIEWADKYNDIQYFQEDPIAFPRHFAALMEEGKANLKDVEIAAVFAAHLAWGRRAMIIRDCERLFTEMDWRPYDYVMSGEWRNDDCSLHRTIKWSETARICRRLKEWYSWHESLEILSVQEMRTTIFGQKESPNSANKKINLMKRWMVRDDGKVDLGLWNETDKRTLLIPLDTHVQAQAMALGLTQRQQKDLKTAIEISEALKNVFPEDPCLGDFALFGYGVTHSANRENDAISTENISDCITNTDISTNGMGGSITDAGSNSDDKEESHNA